MHLAINQQINKSINQQINQQYNNSTIMETIHSSKAPEPVGLYPHAKRVGNLLFLSGVGRF